MMEAGRIGRMTATVLVAQGAGDMHHPEGSIVLVRTLERELPDTYRVVAPEMPGADNPRYSPWRDTLAEALDRADGDVLIVGHSFGGSVVLKLLTEAPPARPIRGLFLVAVPWWGKEGWSYEEFAVRDDFATRLPDVPVFLYHSVDDPHVPFDHLALYEARIPRATAYRIPGAEHSFRSGLPELVRDIRAVAEQPA
jgi:serine hydrolase